MKLHFLGTAASEGFPALFCRCATCNEARRLGGKNIRTRTSLLIDDVLKIDFPPDTYHHLLRDGLDLAKVRDLFFTHSHSDHLLPGDLRKRLPAFARGCDHPLQIHANETVLQKLRATVDRADVLPMHLIHPFEPVEAETATVIPLPADHDPKETCLLFHIERNGQHLLYGHDTGWFPEKTWAWLAGHRLDAAILDCTCGLAPENRSHMGIPAVLATREKLLTLGCLTRETPVVATHFSHGGGLLHPDLEATLSPHGIHAAYDGMILNL
ncbi:MAG: hypothetical protein LBK99_21015 [Opitutaceae bacterium]|jgi:phosphoribosyl 1,2-cyclic phosphate phosphodiesterase|nr:hypothetical protein [Opitutaceae bacterium]